MKISYPTRRTRWKRRLTLKVERRERRSHRRRRRLRRRQHQMLRDENEANVRCRETAVVKKEDSRLAEDGRSGRESSRFLKQQIIFPIYEDARAKRLGARGGERMNGESYRGGRKAGGEKRGRKSVGGESWRVTNEGALARHFAVRGPIITSALKLASPDPSTSPSSTFNRIFLPPLADNWTAMAAQAKGRGGGKGQRDAAGKDGWKKRDRSSGRRRRLAEICT